MVFYLLYFSFECKNIFFEFTDNFLKGEGVAVRNSYKDNFNAFYKNFKITDQLMQSFRQIAEQKGVVWNDAQYKTDEAFLRNRIKALLARSIFGSPYFFPISFEDDKQLKKAITLFPEATKIAKLK